MKNRTYIDHMISYIDGFFESEKDLKDLVNINPAPKIKLSELAGKLSPKTAEALQKDVAKSRNEWEDRLNK